MMHRICSDRGRFFCVPWQGLAASQGDLSDCQAGDPRNARLPAARESSTATCENARIRAVPSDRGNVFSPSVLRPAVADYDTAIQLDPISLPRMATAATPIRQR